MILIRVIACVGALLLAALPAEAKKLALVIGVGAYEQLPALRNPTIDADGVEATLTKLGFAVTVAKQPTRRGLLEALDRFETAVAPGDEVFFYFSGHGVALNSRNLLLAKDMAKDASERVVAAEAVAVDQVITDLQARGAKLIFAVIDACRDNPFAQVGRKSIGQTKGLARVDAPAGAFVLYAAGPGQQALDRLDGRDGERYSVFTRKLLPLLETPGLTHSTIAKRVQAEVYALAMTVQHPQLPEISDRIVGEIVLLEAAQSDPASRPTPRPRVAEPVTLPPPSACDTVRLSDGSCLAAGSGKGFRDTTRDGKPCPDCPDMVAIAAGTGQLGSPKSEPERFDAEDGDGGKPMKIAIAKPFAVGRYAVTRGEFAAFVKERNHKADGCYSHDGKEWKQQADKSWRSPGFTQDDKHPVVCVNWNDAQAYVTWLSDKTGHTYRLLSEAEREYAARAGNTTPFWWSDTLTPEQVNYDGSYTYNNGAKDTYRQKTVPVDSFAANPWGLYNVHGNVWEWTQDCWNDKNAGNPGDGLARETGDCSRRVLRGGSWVSGPRSLRAATRSRYSAVDRFNVLGFRVARTF